MTILYEKLLKPLLFTQDPERVHDAFTFYGQAAGALPPCRWVLSLLYNYRHPALGQTVGGVRFENPVGLAAGFDKDCRLMKVLPSVGFGFEEVGSITAEPYKGNPGPRLVRLPADRSIIVYYGLKNKGAERLLKRLLGKRFRFPIGVSVAKTNKRFTSEEEKLDDWLKGITLLTDVGTYMTINLSCPNTYDKSNYCDPKLLGMLLRRIDEEKIRFGKPVFLKLTADLTEAQADEIIRLCAPRSYITGFILANLVKNRNRVRLQTPVHIYEQYSGGLSGKVVQLKALSLVRHFRQQAGNRFVLIGCGGIFTAEDAYAYIKGGATLIQLITGMIYRGPGTIKEINKGLVKLLKQDGYKNISQAVGAELHKE
jgi:dihydroorotate dehydrogenase